MSQPAEIDLLAFVGLALREDWTFEAEDGVPIVFPAETTARLDIRDTVDGPLLLRLDSEDSPPTISWPNPNTLRLDGICTLPAGNHKFDLVVTLPNEAPDVWVRGGVQAELPVTQVG